MEAAPRGTPRGGKIAHENGALRSKHVGGHTEPTQHVLLGTHGKVARDASSCRGVLQTLAADALMPVLP